MPGGLQLGIVLVLLGAALAVLAWALLRTRERLATSRPTTELAAPSTMLPPAEGSADGVLILQAGGRVEYLNQAARSWFGLTDADSLDLERLLRRVRPADDFLKLCASPGQKRLNVNGQPCDATSYQVPGAYPQMLLSLRDAGISNSLSADRAPDAPSLLRAITDFGTSIASSLDLESTARSILESTLRFLPEDQVELAVWEQESRSFAAYRLEDANGSIPRLGRSPHGRFDALTGQIAASRLPAFLPDALAIRASAPEADLANLHSFIGVPLLAGGELVGVLGAAQSTPRGLGPEYQELLQLLAPQIAASLRNALLYEQERRRRAEYSALAGLGHAMGAVHEPDRLFPTLLDNIAPLFDAEIIGFLIYDENRRTLEAQSPFRGLPGHLVRMYRVRVEAGGAAAGLLSAPKAVFAEKAAEDETWRLLGLTDFAAAASLRDSALFPLVASGRMRGFLQLSHRAAGSRPFSESELRLIQIVCDQAAGIIDSAVLVRQNQERLARAEALRRHADVLTRAPSIDDALSASLRELSGFYKVDLAAAFLLDESVGDLRLHARSAVGVPSGMAAPSVVIDSPKFMETATALLQPRRWERVSLDASLPAFYRPFFQTLALEAVILAPLSARGRALGELVLGTRRPDSFDERDTEFLNSAGAALSATLDSLWLSAHTDATLQRRVEQLTSIARLSRELVAATSIDGLLQVIQRETIRATHADCGSIVLTDPEGIVKDPRSLQSAGCLSGEEFSGLELRGLRESMPFLVSDFARQQEHAAPHEGVRSAAFIPLTDGTQVIGLIQLHSTSPDAFDPDALETGRTLAIQASVAIANARHAQEQRRQAEILQRRSATLQKFSAASHSLSPELPIEESLAFVAQGIQESTPFRVVLVSVYEPETGLLRRVAGAGIQAETLAELQARKQPLSSLQLLTKPEFRISNSYYIPADQTPVLPADIHFVYASQYSGAEQKQNAWDPDDFLLLPLEDPQGAPLGLISLDDPANGLRPDRATIESVELFAEQAVQVIMNARRLVDLNSRIDALTAGISRQQQLLSVTQNDLPVLLRKDLEQTIALHALDRRAQRVRAGLSITESVSRQLDASSALLALGRELLTQFGLSMALIAERTPEGARLVQVLGNVPSTVNVEALFGQRNPLRTCLQTGGPVLVPNLEENEEWRDSPLLGQLRAKGVLSLPVLIENNPVAAVMALSNEPLPPLTEEDRQVYFQISRQASVVLQNISLLNETRRRLHEVNILLEFSRQLSGLDPGHIVQALLQSARHALAAAHAGAVWLWNEHSQLLEPRGATGYADDESMLRLSYQSGQGLPGVVFAAGLPRRVDEIDFARDYALQPADLGLYRRATGGRLPVSSMVLPIIVEDQRIGLLVLDNFNTPAAFRPEDEALILSLAQQAALSLENVRLLQALTERAGQLEGLNTLATAMTSSLRSGELVSMLLDQVGRVLPYDTATLWTRDGERLSVAAARGFPDTESRLGLSVDIADSALFQEVTANGQPLFVPDVRADPRFPSVETPRLSWLGIPMVATGRLTGLIALEKWQASFYTPEQIQLGATLASQAAVALQNATLFESSLDHASALDERSQRLARLNRFSSSLGGLLDANQVLALTAQEMLDALGAARVAAVSIDGQQSVWVTAAPASSQAFPQVLPNTPLIGRLRESLGIFTTETAAAESELAPLRALLARETERLLALPLTVGRDLLALMFVSNPVTVNPAAAEVELARTIANQAAIALQNARLYQSTVRTAEQLTLLNQSGAEIGTSLDPEAIYTSIRSAAARLMPVDAFVISLLDHETQQVDAVYVVDGEHRLGGGRVPLGRGLGSNVIISGRPVLLEDAQALLDLDGGAISDGLAGLSGIAVPMTIASRVVGMLSARSRRPNAYSADDLRILSTLANQAVVTIQNGRLFAETQRLAQELEERVVERTSQLRREQQNTETLLRILTEVSSSLDLDRALDRTLSLLNDAVQAEQGTIMLVDPEDSLLHYRAGFGYASEKTTGREPRLALKIGEGLAGWVVRNREAALVDDVHSDARWLSSPTAAGEHRSAVLAPLMVADDVIGVLMVFSRQPAYFGAESLALVKAIANQVAVAINNAHLYELIRDQAERLGALLRKEEEEASRSQAILESVADGVLVTDPENRVSFVNNSVQRILGAQASQLTGQSLERFAGLFGEPGQTWLSAIKRWSDAPALYSAGDTYAERLELGNNRIALIHLAPVILEDDFLGTVSILRDITHEVEVDRLKSEFVATVSHELRTPMTAIKGYVEMLMMGAVGAVNENQHHFLEIVQNNIDRLNSLVGDLLDVSRIESGKVALQPVELDLHQVAEQAIVEMQQKAEREKKSLSFSLKAPKSLPSALGDAERVRQILRTLLDNSYNYTPENGSVVVTLRSVPKLSEVQVDVVDDGIGISPVDQARVFERFFRGEDPMVLSTPGTGLGLSIARQLVEMHRGRISVQSDGTPGNGSTFSFTLPLYPRGAEAPAGQAPASARRKAASKRTAPLHAGPK